MTTWKTTYISAVVHQAGDNPIINEGSTTVTICDEAAGAFISLTDSEGTTIKLDQDEFEIVANVAKGMLECFNAKHKEDHCIDEVPPGENYVTPFAAICDLLAVIHRDNGSRTGMVGIHQSCKDAESLVRKLHSDGVQSKSVEWTSTRPTNGGIYWVQFDHSIAPQSVEVYRLDEDDVWRARVVGNADNLGNHIASFQVESLANALWCGPLSAPTLNKFRQIGDDHEAQKT